ncbi:MAG TPA: enoyl-CoA hydratase-related protein [Pseudonocardiaceae bacterium]
MTYAHYEQDGFVATVTIDRQEVLNALDDAVLADLDEAVNQVDLDQTRCLIITGAGNRAFVAGADIARMSTMTRQEAAAFGTYGNAVFRRIEKLPVPTIAAINGYALGGGCELACACDIRIATEHAKFGQPEVGLGITAGFGGTQRLARVIGVGRAKELLYTGRTITAAEALRIGLITAAVPADQLMGTARQLAGQIAGHPPVAVRATKAAIDLGQQVDIDTGISIEVQVYSSCYESTGQREAMQAFLRKRSAG